MINHHCLFLDKGGKWIKGSIHKNGNIIANQSFYLKNHWAQFHRAARHINLLSITLLP